MSTTSLWDQRTGLIAIIRGVVPESAVAVAEAIAESGFAAIEVPLNSPAPLDSIARIRKALGPQYPIGAGTVLTVDDVHRAADAGAEFIVSPNTDVAVITATRHKGLGSYPGVATPSEAFVALNAGATAIKLFPADSIGTAGLRAWRSVLPAAAAVIPVGGIDAGNLADWVAAGASGAGIGSSLYRPVDGSTEALRTRARAMVEAWRSTSSTVS